MFKMLTVFISVLVLLTINGIHPNSVTASTLINGSFETSNFISNNDGAMSLSPGSADISGWSIVNGEIVLAVSPNVWGSNGSNGNYFLDLTGYHDSYPYGGVSQSVNLTSGNTYRLTFDLGTDQHNWLESGGPISVLATAGNVNELFTYNPTGDSISTWDSFGLDFTASADLIDISFIGISGKRYIGLDNVSLEALSTPIPTPEPSTFILLGLGMVGVVFLIRKRNIL